MAVRSQPLARQARWRRLPCSGRLEGRPSRRIVRRTVAIVWSRESAYSMGRAIDERCSSPSAVTSRLLQAMGTLCKVRDVCRETRIVQNTHPSLPSFASHACTKVTAAAARCIRTSPGRRTRERIQRRDCASGFARWCATSRAAADLRQSPLAVGPGSRRDRPSRARQGMTRLSRIRRVRWQARRSRTRVSCTRSSLGTRARCLPRRSRCLRRRCKSPRYRSQLPRTPRDRDPAEARRARLGTGSSWRSRYEQRQADPTSNKRRRPTPG
jgi:hypothetical protein